MQEDRVHASAVAIRGAGLLILGPSGSGKSSLALALMAVGADLVADDRVILRRCGAAVTAQVPETLRGLIEARGVGILRAAAAAPVPLALVADLGAPGDARLPAFRDIEVLGVRLPLVSGPMGPHLAPALRQYLLAGRSA